MSNKFSLNAQVKHYQTISVGDTIPDFVIPKIIRWSKKTAKSSEFKDKLLIIDFWDTSCAACVAAMPHMQELQNYFGSKISIIPVTAEEEKRTLDYLKTNRYTKNILLPSVVEDKIFHQLFKHHGVPHEVWIYKGKVIGITSAEYVDMQNISAILEGRQPTLGLKYDFYQFDSKIPLFEIDSMQMDKNTPIQYAAISDYRQKVSAVSWTGGQDIIRNQKNKTIRTYFLNQPIYISYFMYLSKIYPSNMMVTPSILGQPNSVIWEVADRSIYRYKNIMEQGYAQEWIMEHALCFESLYPDTGQNDIQLYKTAINDLDRLLGLHVRWEKRKETVYVVKDINNNKSPLPPQTSSILGTENSLKEISFNEFKYNWNQNEDYPYLFDETLRPEDQKGIMLKLDSADFLENIDKLRISLLPYGFQLLKEEREVDKIVFSEIGKGTVIKVKEQAELKREKFAQNGFSHATEQENREFLERNKLRPEIIVLPSGLQYKIIKAGNGKKPNLNSNVKIHYISREVNGKIFDSSYTLGIPSLVELENCPDSWKEALQLMSTGAKWIIYSPAKMAYGDHTNGGKIPPNSPAIFEIELLQILN
ncbi:FKBP-type peptidyl-prolyl cis-trans isomerase [Pedobacter sp. AW31-3R]|uniref:FKBP-type peptidyl-prolyl cis-trans isomerase n=1 Tax=Pedobacter sp. AW31-3R TaxID=3445781 RepID=UPI003F9F36AE